MSSEPDVFLTALAGVALALLIFGSLYTVDFFRKLHRGDWMVRAQFYHSYGSYWKNFIMPLLFIGLLIPINHLPFMVIPAGLLLAGQVGWNFSQALSNFSLNRQAQVLQELSFALAKRLPVGDFLHRIAADQGGMAGLALHAVGTRLARGESLHHALEQEQIFPEHVRHAFRAAEMGGGALLPKIAHEQATELRRRSETRARLFLALALPFSVLPFLAVSALAALYIFIPVTRMQFKFKYGVVPGSTQLLEWISMPLFWTVLAVLPLGLWLLAITRNEGVPKARGLMTRSLLSICSVFGSHLPLAKGFFTHRGTGRAWRVVLALTHGGRPLPEACLTAGQASIAGPHAERFKLLGQALQRGDALLLALNNAGMDTPDAPMLLAGAASGELTSALETIATWHETSATKCAMHMGLLVPVCATIGIGALVGLTAVGIYEPIFTMPNLLLWK